MVEKELLAIIPFSWYFGVNERVFPLRVWVWFTGCGLLFVQWSMFTICMVVCDGSVWADLVSEHLNL